MAALKSGSKPYFHSFVWGYMQDQFCGIKHKLIPELQGAVEYVAATLPTEMLREAVQNSLKRAQAFLEASGGYLKHLVRPT